MNVGWRQYGVFVYLLKWNLGVVAQRMALPDIKTTANLSQLGEVNIPHINIAEVGDVRDKKINTVIL